MISETESFKVDLELILAQESAECDYGKNALKSKVVVELLGCTLHLHRFTGRLLPSSSVMFTLSSRVDVRVLIYCAARESEPDRLSW
jgi:hypothetical protein